MKAPIFKTSGAIKKKAVKKLAKKMANLGPAKPHLLIEPRAYFGTIGELKNWVGASAGVVRRGVADPKMLEPGYWDSCKDGTREATDSFVEGQIRYALTGCLKYTRLKLIKSNHPGINKWLTLAVYTAKGDPNLLFLDAGIGGGPEVVYGHPDSDGVVRLVVNADEFKDVTLAVAAYAADDQTIAKVERQLKRSK